MKESQQDRSSCSRSDFPNTPSAGRMAKRIWLKTATYFGGALLALGFSAACGRDTTSVRWTIAEDSEDHWRKLNQHNCGRIKGSLLCAHYRPMLKCMCEGSPRPAFFLNSQWSIVRGCTEARAATRDQCWLEAKRNFQTPGFSPSRVHKFLWLCKWPSVCFTSHTIHFIRYS